MARRVFVHVGLPKTATSYLQTILWGNRDLLASRGLLLPGAERRDHLWTARAVRQDKAHARAPEWQQRAWERVRADLAATDGDAVVSHEFLASASAEQAVAMVGGLPAEEVHLVVTAREPLGLFTASWQESLKNGATTRMPDYGREVSDRPADVWNWRTLDLRLVLERWAHAVPPERSHVLVLDPGAPRDDVWHRFAAVVGLDPEGVDLSVSFPNTSMGVAEAETLRRINERLTGFGRAYDRGVWIRTFLADERLVPRGGDRFWPEPDQVEDCRRRGEAAVAHLAAHPYDVVGDPRHLLVPDDPGERRLTGSVTDAEVAAVAVDLVATMLGDVRRLKQQASAGRRAATGPARLGARVRSAVRSRLSRARGRGGAGRR